GSRRRIAAPAPDGASGPVQSPHRRRGPRVVPGRRTRARRHDASEHGPGDGRAARPVDVNRLHRWYCRSDHWRRTVAHDLLDWTVDGAPLGEHLLELGAGHGTATTHLATRVSRLTAIDVELAALDSMRRGQLPGASAVRASAVSLPFAN